MIDEPHPHNDVVIATLTARIQRQDHFIAELQGELQRAREASVERMLGQLRQREAVLLYVGHDVEKLIGDLDTEFRGHDAVRVVSNSLFVLDNAPVPSEMREAIRKAANHGMNRW